MNNTAKITSMTDINALMSDLVLSTPREISLRADLMASDIAERLASQYGVDTSKVRSILSLQKLEDMARAHLRRNFDPEVTAEQEQLAFTEFGNDIQSRYPIKVREESATVVEYISPMYAPVDQLTDIAEKEIRIGSTRVRRGNALLAFIAEYRLK